MSEQTDKKIPEGIIPVLSGADKNELAVALYLVAVDKYTLSGAAKDLHLSEEDVRAALSFWRGAGIAFSAEEEKPLSPEQRDVLYDTETVASSLEENKGFKSACDALQELYGKIFTRFDYDSLLYLYDHCGLTPEYMCTLASFCVSGGKKSLRYFTKTASNLVSEGIDTYEKLEKHIEKRVRATDRIHKLRRLCGFGERAFTTSEQKYVTDWFAEKNLSYELVELAYEKTINAIGEVKLGYMNKILERWYKAGTLTVQEVKKAEEGKKAPAPASTEKSFDTDDFFAAAVAKTKKKHKEKEEKK